MNTLWGWGRASWAGCGPDVRRGGQTLIMGYSADKSPLIGHLAGPLRRLEPLVAQRQEKCGPNRPTPTGYSCNNAPLIAQRVAFVSLLALCLTIPSNWTQDIPSRYGGRHPGLEYSWLYPRIDTAPPAPADTAMPDPVLSPFGSQCARWCPQQGGKPPRSLAPREVRLAIASRSVREERPGMRPAVAMENGQR